MTDKQVDYYLKELEKSEYKVGIFNKEIDTENFDAQKVVDTMNKSFHIMYLIQELKLLRDLQEIGNTSIYGLTKKGRKVVRLGGWLKYLEREEEIERRKERKENAEIKLTEFKVKTGMFPYYVAFASFILSTISIIKSYNNEKTREQQSQEIQLHKKEKTISQKNLVDSTKVYKKK
tara:strand:+ start:2183 stop:2710 length:528 start_codon:yes stop_codon:yes gene_type:complete